MKITKEDYKRLSDVLQPVLRARPDLYLKYKSEGFSDMRFNWDMMYVSKFDTCSLYSYLNDTHINTALAKIIGNSGKGKLI